MYNTYLKVKPSNNGNGLFTTVDIPAKIPILEFKGDIIKKEDLKFDQSQILQISQNLYLGPSGDIDDYINHSCNPNCSVHVVGSRAVLYSLYFITKDTEITFDYSTTSTDSPNEWNMPCFCNSPNCRKLISGYHSLDENLKKDYKDKGIIPMFLTEPIFLKKIYK